MSSNTVVINNEEQVQDISTALKNRANVIDEKFNQTANLFLNGDSTEWAGKDADAYKQKLEELRAKITSSVEDVKNMSLGIIKQSGQIIEQDSQNANDADQLA